MASGRIGVLVVGFVTLTIALSLATPSQRPPNGYIPVFGNITLILLLCYLRLDLFH